MSSVQLHKASISTSTSITNEQSQKLIQTMLTMSFGCVAFLRGLFADDDFIDQRFIPTKFEKNHNPAEESVRTESLRVKTLVRGRSSKIDMFLDWIDKGAIDAIRKGYLEALSFSVFLNKDRPQDLHEVYTFSFDYIDSRFKIDINGTEETITLLNTRRVVQQLMRRFIIITQSLDPLPDKKYMAMRILFNDSCPDNYQPPFFKSANGEPIATIKTKVSDNTYTPGHLSTGHHNIKMNIITAPLNISSSDEFLAEIDPFDNRVYGKLQKPPVRSNSVPNGSPSQTTTMLRSFIENTQLKTNSTQVLSDILCECGSSNEIKDCPTIECAICHNKVHSFCYGKVSRNTTTINCYSCRAKSFTNANLHENLGLLMNMRKFYKLLLKFGIPPSVTKLHRLMGFEHNLNIGVTVECLSFGLLKGLILIDEKPLIKSKKASNELRVGSDYFNVDVPGIVSINSKVVKEGRYGLSFIPSLRGRTAPAGLRSSSNKTKTLLFDDSESKFLSIDAILDYITLTTDNYDTKEEDIIDSSPFSSSRTNIGDQLSNLNLQNSQEYVGSPLGYVIPSSKKRNHSLTEVAIKGDDYCSSQPVIVTSRLKRRKKSVSGILSSDFQK